MLQQLRAALAMLIALTVLTGILYPLIVTGIAQAAFPDQSNGSLIMRDGETVGSTLIGQPFSDPKYFWGRPSATGPMLQTAGAILVLEIVVIALVRRRTNSRTRNELARSV